ncbi:hypothetical protein JXO59_11150, partial [candidate division KSB1 bacterium]|nr:hypothetical protein [candidate division KSB1 bacterium]
TLPLKDGYSANVNQFELMAGKAKPMSVNVLGSEAVMVGSDAIDSYKVEIKPIEDEEGGSVLWIAKDSRRIVKSENKLPAQMGGGTVVSELQP